MPRLCINRIIIIDCTHGEYINYRIFKMEASFQLNYCMRGYHIYKKVWQSNTMEILSCKKEVNIHDPYAVSMVNETRITVGHVPRKISAVCYMFIQRGGSISCQVPESRRYSYDLPQGGLEIPCCLTFTGPSKIVEKVRNYLTSNQH